LKRLLNINKTYLFKLLFGSSLGQAIPLLELHDHPPQRREGLDVGAERAVEALAGVVCASPASYGCRMLVPHANSVHGLDSAVVAISNVCAAINEY